MSAEGLNVGCVCHETIHDTHFSCCHLSCHWFGPGLSCHWPGLYFLLAFKVGRGKGGGVLWLYSSALAHIQTHLN